jgi:signal transduction histidine kinase/ActR/RegA family two-component response regulator
MAGDGTESDAGTRSGAWRGALAAAGALLATLLLVALMTMVSVSNRARDDALASERHSYDVMLLTRTVDGTLARAEAALGRYVLDEKPETGTLYYTQWRSAQALINELQRLVRADAAQAGRVVDLQRLYGLRGRELAAAAAAASRQRGEGGVNFFFAASKSPLGPQLSAKLGEISAAERIDLRRRMSQTGSSGEQADKLTTLLGWLAVLIGFGAVVLGWLAYRAISERLEALRSAADEASRADRLEEAVRERTHELTDANERLRQEAAEREAAEAQLRQVQKMEAVGQLTGGIAHDFNNMLAVVVGGLDLARRRLSSDRREVEFHLDNAMEGATRAAALTRRLLAFARAEPLRPEGIAPTELVEGMLDLVDRSIGERITVDTAFPEEAWQVRVDTNQLENAILNMAVNGRDAMDGEGRLRISVENLTVAAQQGELEPGDYVKISVSDSGTGIAPENLERVFEPFFTTKPVELARPAADVGRHEPAPAGTPILVVEDDPRVSRATMGALEELGYRPTACASGVEALEILAQDSAFELIITDVMMPEMTGPELVRRASELYPWIGVLFVTGYVGEAGEAEDLTGWDMLRKPFTVAALADSVAAALAHRVSGSRPASRAAAAE